MLTKSLTYVICLLLWCCASLVHETVVAQQTTAVDFEKQIRPLLRQECGSCHGPKKQKSDLRLDAKHSAFKGGVNGRVIVEGDAKASELIRRITSEDDDLMPPEGVGLTEREIQLLTRWINEGANWPETEYDREAKRDPRRDHWAFQPIAKPELHVSDDGTNLASPIDQLIGRRLSESGLAFSPKADRRTLMRRLSLDLLGLPPSPEDVERFIVDQDPAACEKLVNRMLASPRHGERWAQHWLDLVRYADTHGFEVNTPRENAWRYRDYVIQSFNEDKPYDQFIKEQLAGDSMDADEATGFLVAAAVLLPGQIGKDEKSKRLARQDELDEMIVGTSATFMGLTIGCARCHDHKFDPISQRDYYALQAFFAGVHYGDRPLRNAEQKQRLAKADEVGQQVRKLEMELRRFGPNVLSRRTVVIDEQDKRLATLLIKEDSLGENPPGVEKGYHDDSGSPSRLANISGGYTFWWNKLPGKDLVTYRPGVDGRFQLWISWGAHGGDTHTRDARYILDSDGDLRTKDDQTEIAIVDQRRQVGAEDVHADPKPLWSGLKNAGIVNLTESSKIILRSGETGTGISADVIVLQEVKRGTQDALSQALPYLRTPVNARKNVEQFEPVDAKFIRFTALETTNDNRYEPCIDELEVYGTDSPDLNIALASEKSLATSSGNLSETGKHQLKHINDGVYGNDRSWISNQKGGGWVQIELPKVAIIDRVIWGRDRNLQFADRLPVRYRIDVSLDGYTWQTVASHSDRQPYGSPFSLVNLICQRLANYDVDKREIQQQFDELEELRSEKQSLEKLPMAYAGVFRQPHSTYLLRRGDPEQKLDQTAPATPYIFEGISLAESDTDQQRRTELANWVASSENPLTARVMVNRIWQFHFGRGLVSTPSDFGLNGQLPTHPELLDWLAGEFIESGWSVKHIHRLIVNSRTYQQASTRLAADDERDDRLLWRFPSRRIEAEAIRDSMLAVSGELNLKMGGRGFDFFKSRGGLTGFPPVADFESDGFRRMIYAHKIRMEKTPVFGAFDCPDAGQAMPERGQSTTAIQALNLFNSPFVIKRANQFAERVRRERPNNLEAQIERAFQLALEREPNAVETAEALKTCELHGLEVLCRVLFNSNEFLFIE